MKAISASVVVLTGAAVLCVGTYVQHDDTAMLVMAAGVTVALLGLIGWFKMLKVEPQ